MDEIMKLLDFALSVENRDGYKHRFKKTYEEVEEMYRQKMQQRQGSAE